MTKAMKRRKSPSPARSFASPSDDEDYDQPDDDFDAPHDAKPNKGWAPDVVVLPSSPRPANGRSNIANYLPYEILIQIFRKLTNKEDQHSVLLVSRTWCQCSVELLWHKLSVSSLQSLLKMMHIITRKDQTFAYATFIRRLNFSAHSTGMTDEIFVRLAPCVRLERLTLSGCSLLTDSSLTAVFSACFGLVAVDLSGVTEVTDASIKALANTTVKLQGINLSKCKLITDEGVLAVARCAPMLRRIKLHGLVLITDISVSAIATSCPLLLEIDLSNCTKLTDLCIRDIWKNQHHLRELQLANITNLTDDAFPSPPPSVPGRSNNSVNPFPNSSRIDLSTASGSEEMPPLYLSYPFDHLRILDMTSCAQITDAGIEGILSNCPKIRHIVLAKCTLLTDESLASLGKLAKNLHYIHLGHVASITDRGVTQLAQVCPRIRYIDLACCSNLTDLSVSELASLPKLRRVGLVRLPNLTDNAVFALGERHTGLERIHLSYCDNISVAAIHFLLQRLHKLTHLSLTGITQFRRKDLRAFCRPPPKEFNQHQRMAFCVYSGKGVTELRKYLHGLALRAMDGVQEQNLEDDNDTIHPNSFPNGGEVDEPESEGDDTPAEDAIVWPPSHANPAPTVVPRQPRGVREQSRRPGRQLLSAGGPSSNGGLFNENSSQRPQTSPRHTRSASRSGLRTPSGASSSSLRVEDSPGVASTPNLSPILDVAGPSSSPRAPPSSHSRRTSHSRATRSPEQRERSTRNSRRNSLQGATNAPTSTSRTTAQASSPPPSAAQGQNTFGTTRLQALIANIGPGRSRARGPSSRAAGGQDAGPSTSGDHLSSQGHSVGSSRRGSQAGPSNTVEERARGRRDGRIGERRRGGSRDTTGQHTNVLFNRGS
ncbi:uncharacterized protein EI90DRAFT_2989251 [Cantharellus anzutake]|uniref:uncharacterized protein n=1 Tax=Cantharellus anzutake TaxID=1750568 RepID=UPI001908386E|nr:uncharacterized protein EI90DRAFT_2989251 [Cantharellus anzutake]KAF8341464.1 hypothetical protein EI90DRAFT_2989251 [Cantharellus anzutake]